MENEKDSEVIGMKMIQFGRGISKEIRPFLKELKKEVKGNH